MSTSEVVDASPGSWVEDFFWHCKMFQPARLQWGPEQVADVVTRQTQGRLEWSTLADLVEVDEHQRQMLVGVEEIERAMVPLLADAAGALGGRGQVTAAMGLSGEEIRRLEARWSRLPHHEPAHPGVRWARKIPFRNPLSELWEIKQARALWWAAAMMLEDVVCDLIDELLTAEVPAERVRRAIWEYSIESLHDRVAAAREARGPAGDPRRRPIQQF